MRFMTNNRWLNLTISGVLLFAVVAAIFAWGSQPADVREFSSIRDEWERVVLGFAREGKLAPGELVTPKPVPPLEGEERAAADRRLADQCLQLADKHPDTWGAHASPHWAGGFEKHLQTILAKNQERWVRCTGSLALASIAQLSIDRQAEGENLYERFLADFDGQTKGQWQAVEQMVNDKGIFRKRWTGEPPIDVLNCMVDELVDEVVDKKTD